jgi:hypothetical protein
MVDLLRWACGSVLAVVCVVVSGANWMIPLTRTRTRPVPFTGGVAGVLALLVLPARVADWWWLPLAADYGSMPYLLLRAAGVVKDARRRS